MVTFEKSAVNGIVGARWAIPSGQSGGDYTIHVKPPKYYHSGYAFNVLLVRIE